MLDSYTSVVCTKSWGRSSYERDMIELRVNVELKDMLVVAIPKIEEARQVEGNGHKDKHSSVPSSSSCDQPPKGKEANLTLVSMSSTSMEEQVEESDTDGGANDTSLLEDEYYDIYDRYENDAYDLSDEQLAFCDAFDICLRGRIRK
ncbi:hypothetical protein Tco_0836634 [Tanacetum coccineum]